MAENPQTPFRTEGAPGAEERTLDYATVQPGRAARQLRAFWERADSELSGAAWVVVGFSIALVAQRLRQPFIVVCVGFPMMLAGALRYVVGRIGRRQHMGTLGKHQLLIATGLCLIGVLSVFVIAARATEGPRPGAWAYWTTSNQTYHADSRVALQAARPTVVGVAWFAAVATFDYVRRLAAARRSRNNPPPQQE